MNTKRFAWMTGSILVLAVMATVVMASPADAAHPNYRYYNDYFAVTPCPDFHINDVYADPYSDWDRDRVNNLTELDNGLKPCVPDSTEFCTLAPASCRNHNHQHGCHGGKWTWSRVLAHPDGDWDGDGINNAREARYGSNPCAKPCPHPSAAHLAADPNGAWDNDGVSNLVEVRQGTDPCNKYSYNPCPNWAQYQINFMPDMDWDGDGIRNANEVAVGSNPCGSNGVYIPAQPVYNYSHTHGTAYTHSHPHTGTHVHTQPQPVYVAPQPVYVPVQPTCPAGYPYYHPGNGKCYANPVRQTGW